MSEFMIYAARVSSDAHQICVNRSEKCSKSTNNTRMLSGRRKSAYVDALVSAGTSCDLRVPDAGK